MNGSTPIVLAIAIAAVNILMAILIAIIGFAVRHHLELDREYHKRVDALADALAQLKGKP